MKSTCATRKPPGRLDLTVQYAVADADLPRPPTVRRWVRAAHAGPACVTVRFVGVQESRELNSRFRGKDRPTNVLSFPYSPPPGLAGDLVLCVPVLREEAATQGKRLQEHAAHLVVHGVLHLAGFDHETGDDALAMEGREREILGKLGYPDPYGAADSASHREDAA